MIITVTLNPAVDKTAYLSDLKKNELNRLEEVEQSPAGKGINVSKTLKEFGKDSLCLGFIAGDSGEFIKKELDKLNIKNDFIHVDGNTRTNMKIMDQQNNLTELNENGPIINLDDIQKLYDSINQHLKENDILVLSGSAPNGVNEDIYVDLINLAHHKKAKVVLDADDKLFKEGIKAIPDYIKPNKHEVCEYFDADEDIDKDELILYGKRFIQMGVKLVVISLGSEGAIFIDKDNVVLSDPLKVEVKSTVGAGDAMVAAIALSKDENYDDEKMIRFALAFSAGAVTMRGTCPAKKGVVLELMKKVKIRSHI